MVVTSVAGLIASLVLAYAAVRIEVMTHPDQFLAWGLGMPISREARRIFLLSYALFFAACLATLTHFGLDPWWMCVAFALFGGSVWLPAHRHNRRLHVERTAEPINS